MSKTCAKRALVTRFQGKNQTRLTLAKILLEYFRHHGTKTSRWSSLRNCFRFEKLQTKTIVHRRFLHKMTFCFVRLFSIFHPDIFNRAVCKINSLAFLNNLIKDSYCFFFVYRYCFSGSITRTSPHDLCYYTRVLQNFRSRAASF